MTPARALALAVAAALVASSAPVRADDLQGLLEQQVVSTASKQAETASDAPATSTVLTAEDMHRHGIRTLDEAINFLAMGVVVENNFHNFEMGARGVNFNGDYGDHVLLLVNGHTMNEQWGGTAYFDRGMGIPFEIIDHIEVILGPGSVLYGSNAMLAVINIVTKRAKDWDGVHAVVESEIPTTIRGAAGVGKAFKLFGIPSEATVELQYFAQKGPEFTLGKQVESPAVPLEFGGKPVSSWGGTVRRDNYGQLPSAYARIFVGDVEVNLRAEYWKRGSPTNSYTFDDPTNYELDRWVSGDVRYRAVLSPSIDLSSRLYADSYDYRQLYPIADAADGCVGGMPLGCYYKLTGISRWVGLEEQLSVDWLKDGRIFTLVGADGRLRTVGSKTDYIEYSTGRTPGSFGASDLDEKAIGIYAEQILRPIKQVAVNGGARVDIDDRFGTHASPRIAATGQPWEGGTFKAIYAEAFRAPTAYERYYADPSGTVANPNLSPETVRSFELSFDQRVKSQHVLFGVFQTNYANLVLSESLTKAQIAQYQSMGLLGKNVRSADQYQNIASVSSRGFNAAIDGTFVGGKLRYGASMTAAIAREQDPSTDYRVGGVLVQPTTPLVVAAQLSGNARISYELGGLLPTIALAGRLVGTRYATDAFDGGYTPTPIAPVLVEVRLALSGKVPLVPGLSYRGTVDVVSTNQSPYTIGPTHLSDGSAQFLPLDQFRTGIGLFYDHGL
jgi:outer membrane receptor for ferrienterochelin and colicins